MWARAPWIFALVLSASAAHALVWPSEIERVERALAGDDVEARRRAASALSRLPETAARRLVALALADDDTEVRLSAVATGAALHLEGLGRSIAPWLVESDARLRRAAAWALRLDPAPEAATALARALSDAEVPVRLAAAEALGEFESADATLPLLGHLDDAHPEVRRVVVRALARAGDGRSVVPLVGKAQDTATEVRREVARALGVLGDPRAGATVELLVGDREESVRIAALGALGSVASSGSAVAIVALLDGERRSAVRRSAYAALGRIGSPQAIDALMEALTAEEGEASSAVRDALVAAGDTARPRVEACLDGEPRAHVAGACALVLAGARVPEAARRITGALRRGSLLPRTGLDALAKAGDPRALTIAVEYLGHGDPLVREAAVAATAAMLDPGVPDGRAVRPILDALDRAITRRRDRAALAALLGRTGSSDAVPRLAALLAGADDAVLRRVAARSLGFIRGSESERALLSALDDDEPEVRFEAAVSLSHVAGGEVCPLLLDRYERGVRQDRGALALALAGAAGRSSSPEVARRLAALVRRRAGEERDGLLDALGAVPGSEGSRGIVALLTAGADASTRAKAAEALSGHAEAASTLRALATDFDPAVRANAVWALGSVGSGEDLPRLVERAGDPDVTVAGNAVAALGRLAVRGIDAMSVLCGALAHRHPYVRANAAAALALGGRRCDARVERRALLRDGSPVVRAAVARLLHALGPAQSEPADGRALALCREDDPSGAAAAACALAPPPLHGAMDDVTIYVVDGRGLEPTPRAPFALVRPDGLTRLGLADRRGAIRERRVPRGDLRLEVPAPLSTP